MGFLDHSTQNIIVDAVLTDEGRRLLARNDGSFRISMFSLGDDEVDYGIISRYGRAVGKEKIAKNTPVFEAQTKKDIAIRSRLMTLSNRTLTALPTLTATQGLVGGKLTFTNGGAQAQNSRTLTVVQTMGNGLRLPDGLYDNTFSMLIPDRFLTISDGSAGFTGLTQDTRIATYKVLGNTQQGGATEGSQMSVTLRLQANISDSVFNIYGRNSGGSREIHSVVSIIGDQSGIRMNIPVQINKNL